LSTPYKFLTGFSFGILFLIYSPAVLKAQGNLLINPKRIVFEGNKRIMDLNLANTGNDSARYNVSFLQYRMKEDGSFEEIKVPDAGQNFSDKYLRIFPRTVVLGPNEAQVVKVQLTRTNLLVPGEYRSHLYFRAVPNIKPLGEETQKDTSKTISVKLVPIFGISIPVIIRVGESTSKVALTDLAFQISDEKMPQLKVQFNRMGNMSVYGDLTINHISPEGKSTQVGIVKGISVYTPNLKRKFLMNLDKTTGVNFREGKIEVLYNTQPDANSELMARAELLLN
jgi:hypothetical protein